MDKDRSKIRKKEAEKPFNWHTFCVCKNLVLVCIDKAERGVAGDPTKRTFEAT